MKIRKLELEGYKVFDTLELDFTDPEGNTLDTVVLAGVNGCGKTSLLDLFETICLTSTVNGRRSAQSFDCNVLKLVVEAPPHLLNSVPKQFILNEKNKEYVFIEMETLASSLMTKSLISEERWIYYGIVATTHCYIKINFLNDVKIEQEAAKYLVDSLINGVVQKRELPAGIIIQETIDKINNMFDGMDMKTKLVDITATEPIFESFNGKKISINQLSSGEKQLFCQAAYLQKLNLHNSIILIDEPETSLHPTWQRNILKLYQNIGKNNQIIVATHSPHIIASVKPESLFVLYPNAETGKIEPINMAKAHRHTKGVEPNRILQEIMGLDDLRDPETRQQIDEIAELLRLHPEQVDLPENQAKIEKLRDELGSGDPFIIRMAHQLLLINRRKQSQ